MANNTELISWSNNFSTGIDLIDNQHKELVKLINELFDACRLGSEAAEAAFKDAMSRMVDYVRFHFSAELEILKRVGYPGYNEHAAEHDSLVRQILEATAQYGQGNQFIPNQFVRTLKDWVLGHIAISDKAYANYINEQKHMGILKGI